MSFTARRLVGIAEHVRTVRLTRHEAAEFDLRLRHLADYLIGRFV